MEMEHETLKHLFQREFSKMVAVIGKLFGLQHIEIAEDIVSETFLLAAETWGIKGIPQNPTAWLYAVAKQKTLYHFRRNKIFNEKVIPELQSNVTEANEISEVNFSYENIKDSQLQMMFAVCNPAIASEAQIGLALRILCGFGIDEIAEAFLSNKDTINKRLFRAKEKLRIEKVKMELPPENEIANRLDNVLRIIYLLFSEGYYSKTQNQILRKDLCLEALRLGLMLIEYERTNRPNHGDEVSSYHLEARIAYWHCIKEDTKEKWEDILQLYDQLLLVNYSPSVALNRIFALYKAKGQQAALVEAEKLKLENNHFYFLLRGELYKDIDNKKAKFNFQTMRRSQSRSSASTTIAGRSSWLSPGSTGDGLIRMSSAPWANASGRSRSLSQMGRGGEWLAGWLPAHFWSSCAFPCS